jgi:hypothetical protein
MSPSVYLGCQIQDDIADALSLVNQTFRDLEQEADAVLSTLSSELSQLTGTKQYAAATIGSVVNNQILWKAKESGISGNDIKIIYLYKGPDFFGGSYQDRPPSAEAIDSVIYVTLAVSSGGVIDPAWTTAASLPIWLAGSGVADLVTGSLVGSGSALPEVVPLTALSGGEGTPLSDAEDAANGIAQQLGKPTYKELMTSLNIPVVDTPADAAAYLESSDDEIVIINKKLFLVSGTNLVGIRQLYNILGKNLRLLKEFLEKLSANDLTPYLFITENVESVSYEEVCGSVQPVVSVVEVYRSYNESLYTVAGKYTNGDITRLNGYIFWINSEKSTIQSYSKLVTWGYDDVLITDILLGDTPVVEEYFGEAAIPIVSIIEDATLFLQLNLTDSEIEELLEKDVKGISVPSETDPEKKNKKIDELLNRTNETLPNGMRSKVKTPIVLPQAVDLSKTGEDSDLAKELATRGRACARQSKSMTNKLTNPLSAVSDVSDLVGKANLKNALGDLLDIPNYKSPNLDSLDIPNLPSADLPNVAKKVESAFGALSSVVHSASRLFDRLVDKMLKAAKSVLNSLQNLASMTENLLNNNLVKCLLGSASAATGLPNVPSVGSFNAPSLPGGSVSIGGIPIPMGLLKTALTELSDKLDATITTAFEQMMKLVEKPLCMVQSILDDILGFDLGAELNPCKEATDPNDNCDPEKVQGVIEDSVELSSIYNSLPQANLFPKTPSVEEVTEEIEDFTGMVKKTAESIPQEITRGVKEVMEDITKSLNSKVESLNQLNKAIKKLIGEDIKESASTISEQSDKQTGCAPPSIGVLTDAITAFV